METAIVSLICIALVVFGGMTMSQGFLTSVDSTTVSLKEIGQANEDIMRTQLSLDSADPGVGGASFYVTLNNAGQTKLSNFSKWDVIVQYYDDAAILRTAWLPYTAVNPPGDNEWTVQWIYYGSEPETFEPGIFNPGERMKIRADVNPEIGDNTTNMVVIATPQGVSYSIQFGGP
ncbi:MAG: hypothetical protein PHR43_04970 [Dehalococcoidales bacterium]|nr:hypothetical protein [Dehalococcoidales bacterium]